MRGAATVALRRVPNFSGRAVIPGGPPPAQALLRTVAIGYNDGAILTRSDLRFGWSLSGGVLEPGMSPRDRLGRDQCQLLVIDIQEKLLPHIHDHARVLAQAERMIRAALTIGLPVIVSEQYPKGLGPTDSAILAAAASAPRVEKMSFSFCDDAHCRSHLTAHKRPQVLLVGIETHVCILQTALDLLGLQLQPIVLADAVGSRRLDDCQVALAYLRSAGAVVTTVESAIFQLVRESGTELFRRILPLVR